MIIQQLPASSRRQAVWPWMLLLISVVCLVMKAGYALLDPPIAQAWLFFWGFVPTEVMAVLAGPPATWNDQHLLGLLTSMFIHADWLHLAGNLAYLWVFGVAVERAIGHWRLALSFVFLGVVTNLFVAWQMADVAMPVIGASGGVSVVIGIYLGLFPGRRMGLWLPLGLYLQFARVPALLVIGSWFILQLLYTILIPISGHVAWWSHIAGFLGGLLAAMILRLVPASINFAIADD